MSHANAALTPRARLRVGQQSGRPTVVLAGRPDGHVLTIPATAVQALDGDTVVIVAAPRGSGLHVEALPVRIGRRSADVAEVIDGVREGTLVVTTGAAIARAEIVRATSVEEQ